MLETNIYTKALNQNTIPNSVKPFENFVIENIFKHLKAGKASGSDKITNEMFKKKFIMKFPIPLKNRLFKIYTEAMAASRLMSLLRLEDKLIGR